MDIKQNLDGGKMWMESKFRWIQNANGDNI